MVNPDWSNLAYLGSKNGNEIEASSPSLVIPVAKNFGTGMPEHGVKYKDAIGYLHTQYQGTNTTADAV